MLFRFDFKTTDGRSETTTFSRPVAVFSCDTVDEVARVFERAEAERRQGRYVAGFVSYEAAAAFDKALVTSEPSAGLPLAMFAAFDSTDAGIDITHHGDPAPAAISWSVDIDRNKFDHDIAAIREAIARGDTYQVNYTFRLNGVVDPAGTPELYLYLRDIHRPGYGAYVDIEEWQLLSLSPELFFRIDDGRIVSQPMKGTASRGLWVEDDRDEAKKLSRSAKDRSENVMIVDLVRNDLSRVASVGSVRASSLFDLERYPGVWQMSSTVEGQLRPDVSLFEVFAALFPAGSITGAPKTSAMRAIRDLEGSARGVYTGAIGYASPNGDAVFNVAIRTATIERATGRATAGVGGGITWESQSTNEYAEAMSKASFLVAQPEFELLETMRLEAGAIVRGDRHLARMAESAEFFDFTFDCEHASDVLTQTVLAHPSGTYRLRLLASRIGEISVEVLPIDPRPLEPATVVVAASPIHRKDTFLYHKTTARSVYERARAERGTAFDVLLWNEAREVTEFTIGNVVAEIDGVRVTPPRGCGLLAGVFRATLLEQGVVRERVIALDDLGKASRLWLVNSLREWVEVRIA